MPESRLDPAVIIAQSGVHDAAELVKLGVTAAQEKQYERGLIFLAEAYNRLTQRTAVKGDQETGPGTATAREMVPANALSYYGLCLAMHKGHYQEAAKFCELAIGAERYVGEHYLNLARVWFAGKNRKKAVDAIQRGLAASPHYQRLVDFVQAIGWRKPPVVPFLPRDNPINVKLGLMRADRERQKPKPPRRTKGG